MSGINTKLGRRFVTYMQRNVMLPDEQFVAAHGAWRSSQIADRPDNRDERIQRLHRAKHRTARTP